VDLAYATTAHRAKREFAAVEADDVAQTGPKLAPDLVTGGFAAESDRLLGLGAVRLRDIEEDGIRGWTMLPIPRARSSTCSSGDSCNERLFDQRPLATTIAPAEPQRSTEAYASYYIDLYK
jgi:hypothetical protein